jgi:hypothetical protein
MHTAPNRCATARTLLTAAVFAIMPHLAEAAWDIQQRGKAPAPLVQHRGAHADADTRQLQRAA